MAKRMKTTKTTNGVMLLLGTLTGLLVGITAPAIANQIIGEAEAQEINVVCESFEGAQGPAGAAGVDGIDGTHATITLKHDPELLGLFSEQNVKVEYHGGQK
jgi:hypothetical protein